MSTNFDGHLFRVSSLTPIMSGLTTYDELYNGAEKNHSEQFGKVSKYELDYESMKNKETKTAFNKKVQIQNAKDKLDRLKLIKDAYAPKRGEVAISDGCRTYLIDVWIAKEFDRPIRDIKNKYLEKGIECEEQGISLYDAVTGTFHDKNTERRDDGFIMGEIDFEDELRLYDNKSSWDIWTFFRNIKYIDKPEQNPYYANAQGYMKLWDKQESKIVYTLIDTPQRLIEREKKNLLYDFVGTEEMYEEACQMLEKNMTYGDIDPKRKIIEVKIKRDQDYIDLIPKAVVACREFLNNFKQTYYELD